MEAPALGNGIVTPRKQRQTVSAREGDGLGSITSSGSTRATEALHGNRGKLRQSSPTQAFVWIANPDQTIAAVKRGTEVLGSNPLA
jgi:hypothetical protein